MSEQQVIVRRLKVVSVVEALLIAFMLGLIFYLVQYVRHGSTITLTPTFTSSTHATTLPNANQAPTLDMNVPPAHDAKIQPTLEHV